jgi:hypothetical protein
MSRPSAARKARPLSQRAVPCELETLRRDLDPATRRVTIADVIDVTPATNTPRDMTAARSGTSL